MRRWNIVKQERKDGNMEIEIVTFTVTVSVKLAVSPNRQNEIDCEKRLHDFERRLHIFDGRLRIL